MALNPLIPLSGGTPPSVDVGRTFSNALLNVERFESIRQGRRAAPLRNRLLEAQATQAEQTAEQTQQLNEFTSIAMGAFEVIPFLEAGDIDGATAKLTQRLNTIVQRGGDPTQTQQALSLLQTEGGAEKLLEGSKQIVDQAQQLGVLKPVGSAGQREFESLVS